MAEYIDRNELKKMVRFSGHGMYYDAYEVQEMPNADVVEVVRCKDCKHSELLFFADNGTTRIVHYKCGSHLSMGMAQEVDENDFCSYGERRADHVDM